MLPVSDGALVIRERLGEEAVIPSSAAQRAGLKEFDIIMEIDNQKITENNYLSDILESSKIGDKIILKVLRQKKIIEVQLKLEERK